MLKRKNILILTQCFPPVIGGIENLIGGLAQALSEIGADVSVFADSPSSANDALTPYNIRRFGGIKLFRRYHKAHIAAKSILSGKVSHVFCDTWKSLEYLRLDAANDAYITVFAHGSEYPCNPSPRKKKRITKALAKADRILAVSAATRERMRLCGVDTNRVGVWHPPIDTPTIPSAKTSLRMAALWKEGGLRLLSVGRLAERKGIDVAIRAITKLKAAYPNLRYIIAGDGKQAPHLRALAVPHKDTIDFIGTVTGEEKSALYESADVFVLPVRPVGNDIEGFGLVFLEAGYFALPSVAGNSGGAAEAVEDGITGLHCNGADVEQVRQILSTLLADDSLRQRLGENAKRKAHANVWALRVDELLA